MDIGKPIYGERTRVYFILWGILFLLVAFLALFLSYNFWKELPKKLDISWLETFLLVILSGLLSIGSFLGFFKSFLYDDLIIYEKGMVFPEKTLRDWLRKKRIFLSFREMASIEIRPTKGGRVSRPIVIVTKDGKEYRMFWGTLRNPPKVYKLIKKGIELGYLHPGVLRETDVGVNRTRKNFSRARKRR